MIRRTFLQRTLVYGAATMLGAFRTSSLDAAVRWPIGCFNRPWTKWAFDDATFRRDLEQLLHPLIAARLDEAIAGLRGPYGLLVVPLLLERGGLRKRVARILVVDCPEQEQVRRVQLRSGLTADEIRRIMATQLPRAERLAQADDIIDNSGLPEALAPQVERLDRRYRRLAARFRAE